MVQSVDNSPKGKQNKMRGSRISSWHIILWNSRDVPFPQDSVHCSDQFVDVRSHFWSVRVILKLS